MRCIVFLILTLCISFICQAQIFPCDGSSYISLNADVPGASTTIYKVVIDENGVDFESIAVVNRRLNALGYNPVDNFLYAVPVLENNSVYRLAADGSVTSIIQEATLSNWLTGAGDIRLADSTYIVHDRVADDLYFYRLAPSVNKTGQVGLTWDPATGNNGTADLNLDDLVVNRTNPTIAYSFQRAFPSNGPANTRGHLLAINIDQQDPDFGRVSSLGELTPRYLYQMGAMFIDASGQLFAYGSPTPPPLLQNTMIQIHPTTATAELVHTGPSAAGNDGCSCPFNIELEKIASVEEYHCDSAVVKFTITLTNNTLEDIPGLTFRDTFPPGFEILQVSPDNGGIGATLKVDSFPAIVTLNGAFLGAETQVSFTILASTDVADVYINQAFLQGLPQRYGGSVPSDDPGTFLTDDPTMFEVPDTTIEEFFTFREFERCPDETITVNGVTYSAAGDYEDVVSSGFSCDSILFIHIEDINEAQGSLHVEVCEGQEVVVNGEIYSTKGVYEQVFPQGSVNGCDSLLYVHVEEKMAVTSQILSGLCTGEDVTINGQFYDTPGVYEQIIPMGSAGGCDSIIEIQIYQLEPAETDLEVTLCPDEIIVVNSESYDMPGDYKQILDQAAANGCDSNLMIYIESGELAYHAIDEALCFEDSIQINGTYYDMPGDYQEVVAGGAANGCDSVIEIHLEVSPRAEGFERATLCLGESYSYNGVTYTEWTEASIVFEKASAHGCDSTVYLLVDVYPGTTISYEDNHRVRFGDSVLLEISTDSDIQTVSWSPGTYLACTDCNPVIAYPLDHIIYSFDIVDTYGCLHSGMVVVEVFLDDVKIYVPNVFSPNGDGVNDYFTIYGPEISSIRELSIYDRWGDQVWGDGPFLPNAPLLGWDGTWNGEPMNAGVYVYKVVVELINGEESVIAGDVTIVR